MGNIVGVAKANRWGKVAHISAGNETLAIIYRTKHQLYYAQRKLLQSPAEQANQPSATMSTEVNGDRGSVTPTPHQQPYANGNGTTKPVPGARRKIKVEITSDAICEYLCHFCFPSHEN